MGSLITLQTGGRTVGQTERQTDGQTDETDYIGPMPRINDIKKMSIRKKREKSQKLLKNAEI